jgi:hypothetical protein
MAGVGTPGHDVGGLRAEHGGATRHDLGGERGVDVPTGVMDEGSIGAKEIDVDGASAGGIDDQGGVLHDGGGDTGRPTAPSMDDVVDTGPDKPGIDETRSKVTIIKLEDGSVASLHKGPEIQGGPVFIVTTPGGDVLEGPEATDHIMENLPLEPIPTGDQLEPGLDPEASEQLSAEFEENTNYSEATWAAWKGSEVNPDPGSEGGGGAVETDMAPFEPDYADPLDADVGTAVPVTPEDVDPGTIDPIE